MLHLIPAVQSLRMTGGILRAAAVAPVKTDSDRLNKAMRLLPVTDGGASLDLSYGEGEGEGYTLTVTETAVSITADSERGAFWAIQTLRQLFCGGDIPCLVIRDAPTFGYRGFYHDITRGKVPTLKTLKRLIDTMAYYKLNALQLYVEHVFPFRETEALIPHTSCLTPEELRELSDYAAERFIDFQPSLSTFGHLYELLQQEVYSHLRVKKDYEASPCRWHDRMAHHTIDPRIPESFAVVRSLIDQYMPSFDSAYFNICCDETFDLKTSDPDGRCYLDFVKQLVSHVTARGKRVMMWADILLQYPDRITELPEDTVFLNWHYGAKPPEESVKRFALLGRPQIVCPGTSSWSRFCERVDCEEPNILKMAEYGYQYGAVGVLNTNWGDWGNPASLEMSLYGMVLGAAKSWSIETQANEAFYADVEALLYRHPGAMRYLTAMSEAHNRIGWNAVMKAAYCRRGGLAYESPVTAEAVEAAQQTFLQLSKALSSETWKLEDFREEFLLCAEGICVLAELGAKLSGIEIERVSDTEAFLARYRAKWLKSNKESELSRIEDIFRFCDSL